MKRNMRIKENGKDRLLMAFIYAITILMMVVTAYPLIYVLSASFSSPEYLATGEIVLFPKGFTTKAYKLVFEYKEIWIGYANTIFYTVAGTVLNLVATLPAAYALSRNNLKGRKLITAFMLVTMYFSGGMIPTYLNIYELGLVNTRAYMLIGGLVSVYNVIVARTFFANSIPSALHDAASIDGCNDFQTFTKIVLPLSKPIIVVLALYYGVGHWNSYFNAMVYLQDRDKYPLQVFLKEILIEGQMQGDVMSQFGDTESMIHAMEMAGINDLMKYAIIVVSVVPMMLIYPKLHKYFEKGVMIGSVKG